jgi:TonB family protein
MKRLALALVAASLLVIFPLSVSAQQDAKPSMRKVTNRIAPAYPELAKRMSLEGTVKVGLVVAPNGKVKEAKVIGGNPVLVDAAISAVRKWRFAAGPEETTELVELKFASPQ